MKPPVLVSGVTERGWKPSKQFEMWGGGVDHVRYDMQTEICSIPFCPHFLRKYALPFSCLSPTVYAVPVFKNL